PSRLLRRAHGGDEGVVARGGCVVGRVLAEGERHEARVHACADGRARRRGTGARARALEPSRGGILAVRDDELDLQLVRSVGRYRRGDAESERVPPVLGRIRGTPGVRYRAAPLVGGMTLVSRSHAVRDDTLDSFTPEVDRWLPPQ